jgi:hypothetical protein
MFFGSAWRPCETQYARLIDPTFEIFNEEWNLFIDAFGASCGCVGKLPSLDLRPIEGPRSRVAANVTLLEVASTDGTSSDERSRAPSPGQPRSQA